MFVFLDYSGMVPRFFSQYVSYINQWKILRYSSYRAAILLKRRNVFISLLTKRKTCTSHPENCDFVLYAVCTAHLLKRYSGVLDANPAV